VRTRQRWDNTTYVTSSKRIHIFAVIIYDKAWEKYASISGYIFKTRSLATDACKKGRVSIGGVTVKPSRTLQRGDIVSVRKPPVEYSFRVVELLSSRVGAKRVPEFMENVTPAAQYELLELQRISGFVDRAKGLGRPTKKDRRDLDQFAEDMPEDLDLFDWDEDWD